MKKYYKILLTFFLLNLILIGIAKIYSQSNYIPDIKFRNLTLREGLSSAGVQCCLVDSYGFLWIGTQSGLDRYDGSSMKVFDFNPLDSNSISDGFVFCLYEDKEHYLWIGTKAGGLNRFDLKTEQFKHFKFDSSDNNSISDNTVFNIIEDNENNLWLHTSNGLNKFDKKTFKFTRYYHSENDTNSVSANGRTGLYKDKKGNIFIGTHKGLNKYNPEKNNFTKIHLSDDDNFGINSITQDENGIFWIAAQGKGILKYNETSNKIENLSNTEGSKNCISSNGVNSIVIGDDGLVWIANMSENAGLDVYDPKTNSFYNFKHDKKDNTSIALNVIWSCYKDKNKNIYFCTNGGGLSYYSPYAIKFKHINKLRDGDNYRDIKVVWGIMYAFDKIWCCTEGTVLTFSKYGDFIKEYPPSATKLKLWSPIHRGSKSGRLYFSTIGNDALSYYDSLNDKFVKCPLKFKESGKPIIIVDAILEDNNGNIWLGAQSPGLEYYVRLFDKDYNELDIPCQNESDIKFIDKNCGTIYQDSFDNLWFGSNGLVKLELKTGKVINFNINPRDSNSAAGLVVHSFCEDENHDLWIAYGGNGFDKLDINSNIFKHFNTNNGLINNYVYSILPDNSGNLWLGTNKGLVKFNHSREDFMNYNMTDGVQDDEFNIDSYCRGEDGILAFGGMNGLNCFYPEEIKLNSQIPALAFTSFKVFDKELNLPQVINLTEEIELSYKDNFFTIQFASLDLANPPKNQYKYKLEGIDKDWVFSGNKNEANYTDIEPGNYIFRVKGSNNDGVWNEEGKSIRIIITPPWWQKWWFRGCVILLVLGFVSFGINKKINENKKRHLAQEEFSRKLIDSHEQERKRLSAELHDSLGQDLVIIKNSANMALNKLDSKPEVTKFIKQISDLSSSALGNVRTISHNLRPVELDKLGLTETIKSIVEIVAASSEINFSSEIDNIDNFFDKNNEVNFCRIIQECLNNILKHSKASIASVNIKSGENEIITVIKDNGIGFNYDEMINNSGMKSFGLTGIYERVKMLNGTLKINSKTGAGTEITINTPLSNSIKRQK